jgi:hypothetical protein
MSQTTVNLTANTATYTKLKSGAWGLRIVGSFRVQAGDRVTVSKKDGSKKEEAVGAVLWSGDGVVLCSIESTGSVRREFLAAAYPSTHGPGARPAAPAARPAVRKYRRGQDCPCCGSEPLDAKLHCWECGFSGK